MVRSHLQTIKETVATRKLKKLLHFSSITTTRIFCYKRHVKMVRKRYKREIVNEINALSANRGQELWKHINRLRKSDIVEEETFVSPEDWISHYQQLLYDNQESHATFYFLNEDLDMENANSPNDDILGKPITTKEIHKQISKLKSKKASGRDSISILNNITSSVQSNLDFDRISEQQIVCLSYNNSYINTPNSIRNFMLASLIMKKRLIVCGNAG